MNKSPTSLEVYQDIFEYYEYPDESDVISNTFTDYQNQYEGSVVFTIIISFCFEMIFLIIGSILCCYDCCSNKQKRIYNYFCNISLIVSKIIFMYFLLKLRNYRIESIKPVISDYIENEKDIIEFDELNDKAAENDLIFFIINLLVCIIIFIIILIITISIFKENGYCNDCDCTCTCPRRNYINTFASNNNNIINNVMVNINNNNANNGYENMDRNIRQNTNAIINSNENMNNNSTRNLTKTKYKGKNKENCIICQQFVNFNDEVIYLPCLHYFHVNCINNWINEKKICPICRASI